MIVSTIASLLVYTHLALSATLTLNVQVDKTQQQALKNAGYNLCIAKLVNGNYTVVWSGNKQWLSNNTFQWQEEFQVFGQNNFTVGALVSASTNQVNIDFGQSVLLDKNGIMETATGSPDKSGKFYVQNNYGTINIGVNALLGGSMLPIFVSPQPYVAPTNNSFEPIETVKAWWALNQTTSTMIASSETPGFEVVYAGTTSAVISYITDGSGNGVWAAGGVSPPNSTTTVSSASSTSIKGSSTVSSASSSSTAVGTVAHFGQCGGTGWTGGTVCIAPYKCTVVNSFYSQCA